MSLEFGKTIAFLVPARRIIEFLDPPPPSRPDSDFWVLRGEIAVRVSANRGNGSPGKKDREREKNFSTSPFSFFRKCMLANFFSLSFLYPAPPLPPSPLPESWFVGGGEGGEGENLQRPTLFTYKTASPLLLFF